MRWGAIVVLALALVAVGARGFARSAARPGVRVLRFRFVDRTRSAHFSNGTVGPRVLFTYVRLPPTGRGPFPLILFGHGYRTTPRRYARLLDAWARAGFVVAAPLFPVEAETAPGGPDESDIVNQPGDLHFVLTQLLAARALHGLIEPAEIAAAGQSDGAETAFADAYERPRYRDPRVKAAVVLSGAELGGGKPGAGPPLLAVQGTRDHINPPRYTEQLYRAVGRPKFALWLLGAGHLPPYTTNAAQLAVVERVTIAFLDHYLEGAPLDSLLAAGRTPITRFVADP